MYEIFDRKNRVWAWTAAIDEGYGLSLYIDLSRLLTQRKYSIYNSPLIDKHVRGPAYKLMDRVEEIDLWYAGLPVNDRGHWKHPEAIVKNCPRNLLSGGMRGHNKPPKKNPKKPITSAEIERLKALLIQVIKRLARHEPDALDLLDQIMPAGDPDDSLEGLI